jgi:hypothetical protein
MWRWGVAAGMWDGAFTAHAQWERTFLEIDRTGDASDFLKRTVNIHFLR